MSAEGQVDLSRAVGQVAELFDLEYYVRAAITKRWAPYCESPIEAMLLTAVTLEASIMQWAYGLGYNVVVVRRQAEIANQGRTFTIVPQYLWCDYRIDFAFLWRGKQITAFVECDGHEFHERTQEQAERDRSRDRAIQMAGIPILRFTGREIFRNPGDVAVEILRFISRGIDE